MVQRVNVLHVRGKGMKKLIISAMLLFVSSMARADIQIPVSGKCHVVASMAGTVQRIRVEYKVKQEEMLARAKEHTPQELQNLMFSIIRMVYESVPDLVNPVDVYRAVALDCMGTEV